MSYVIIKSTTDAPVTDADGEPVVWDDFETAQLKAERWNERHYGSYTVEPAGELDDETTDDANDNSMFDNNDADDSTDNDQTDSLTDRVRRMFGHDVVDEPEEPAEDNEDGEESHTVPEAHLTGVNESRWSLGEHTQAAGLNPDDIEAEARRLGGVDEDLADLFGEAARMVESRTVRGFECPACGLNHGHSDDKHDIRDAFEISPEFTNQTETCPYCHCGVNELAVIVEFVQHIPSQVFTDEQRFAAVTGTEADGDLREAIANIKRQESEQAAEPSIEAALDAAGYEVTEDTVEAFDAFYTRYERIKSAADSAPISDETRSEINEEREAMEELAAEDEDDEDDIEGDLGTVVYLSAGRATIETDSDEGAVNAYESHTTVENGTWSDLTDGTEVAVTEYRTVHGEVFANVVRVTE